MDDLADILGQVTLVGQRVSLVPLAMEHQAALVEAVKDGELWKLWYTIVPAPEDMGAEIQRRLGLLNTRWMLPFTVLDADGRVVGMTTLMNVDETSRRVEIGYTWYAKRVQRTGLNAEAKLLLLGYCFETLGVIAVEFRTHFLNQQSRQAIERLGAKLDGVLRNHGIAKNGTLRDTAVYSILPGEWPTVKGNLKWRLERV